MGFAGRRWTTMLSKDESYVNEPINEGGLSADQADQESLSTVLDRILTKARRFTRAEAGTIYVREGNILRFVAVQNDALARRLGEEELQRRPRRRRPARRRRAPSRWHRSVVGSASSSPRIS